MSNRTALWASSPAIPVEGAAAEMREHAPRLPPALLSGFAALPIACAGHGHPGLLYAARREGEATSGACGMLIAGFRLCYSFSSKGTLLNLVADSMHPASVQRLAGWCFVGEGSGQAYAADVAESMYNQFRLALCKVFAGNESCLDDKTLDQTFAACSLMTGIVVLRNCSDVGRTIGRKETCWRLEVHEFPFPLTRQKLRQEIRSKVKSTSDPRDVEELTGVSLNPAPASSTMEVVDLVSDDDDQGDDQPLISLQVEAPAPRPATDDDEVPLLAQRSSPDRIEMGHQDGTAPAHKGSVDMSEIMAEAETQWRKDSAYARWEKERAAVDADPAHSQKLLQHLDQKRVTIFDSIIRRYANKVDGVVAEMTLLQEARDRWASSLEARPVTVGCAQDQLSVDAADSHTRRQTPAATAQMRTCCAKLCISAANASTLSSSTHDVSAPGAPADCDHAREVAAVVGAEVDEQLSEMEVSHQLQEYVDACKLHESLLRQVHDKTHGVDTADSVAGGSGAQPDEAGADDDDTPAFVLQNSVLVSILDLGFRRCGSGAGGSAADAQDQETRSKTATVRGVLAGMRKGKRVLISRALVLPDVPSQSSKGGLSGVGAGGQSSKEEEGGRERDFAWMRATAHGLLAGALAGSPESNSELMQTDIASHRTVMNAFEHGKGDEGELLLLGYFRVVLQAQESEQVEVREDDRQCLRELSAEGLGLVVAVQDGREIVSAPDFVRIVGFRAVEKGDAENSMVQEEGAGQGEKVAVATEDGLPDYRLQWSVAQEPFLPPRTLRQLVEAERQAEGMAGAGGTFASSLVRQHTVNLRVQAAYLKKHLVLFLARVGSALSSFGVSLFATARDRPAWTRSRFRACKHLSVSMIVCVPYLVPTFVHRHLGPRPLERILPTLQGSMPSLSAVPTMGRRGREEVWRYPRAGPHAGSVALMPFSRATRQAKPALNARGGTNTGMRSMLDRTGTTKAKARNGNALQDGKGRVICNNRRQPRR